MPDALTNSSNTAQTQSWPEWKEQGGRQVIQCRLVQTLLANRPAVPVSVVAPDHLHWMRAKNGYHGDRRRLGAAGGPRRVESPPVRAVASPVHRPRLGLVGHADRWCGAGVSQRRRQASGHREADAAVAARVGAVLRRPVGRAGRVDRPAAPARHHRQHSGDLGNRALRS